MVDLDNIIDFKDTDVNKPSGNTYIEYTDRNGTTSTRSIGDTANRSKYKFHIDVTSSVDGAKTISNIPIGTQYSVVEQNPTATYNDTDSGPMATDYTGAGVSWYGTPGVPANDPGTITLNYESEKNNNSPTVTITNYYRHPSASISVEKAIPAGDTDHQDTEFSFVIDFSAGITAFNADNEPDITLAEGDLRYTYSHVNPPATADPSGASFNSTNNQITVTLKPGQKVKIDGVPANIAYTVTETTPRFWESKYTINGVSEHTGYVASDTTVSGTERAVKFTNTYVTPTKATLTLTKATSTFVPSDVSGKLFKFTVTLTPPSTSPANGSFEGYTVSAAKTGDVAVNPSSYSNSQIVYTVYLQSGQSLNITGLPDGTSYVITEDENGYYATESSSITSYTNITRPISVVQSPTPTNGGNAISTSAAVTVTNNYTDFGALQLTKTLSKTGATTYPDGITTATTFPYVVVLTLPSGMEWNKRFIELIGLTYSATNPTGYTVSDAVENSDDNRVITFTKNVSQDVPVTINNIPKDTTYSVTENYNGTSTSGYGYKKIPDTAVTGAIGTDTDATSGNNIAAITNKYYQLGTLNLTKILYSVDGTSSGENVTFPITVVLTCPSGEWSDYEAITGLPTGANAPSETSTTKTIVYNLSSGSAIPTIGHLPYGTTYQISENLTSLTNYQLKEIKNGSNQTVAENTLSSGVIVNSASVSYTFTNERKTGSLGLTKTVNGDSTALTAAGIVTTGNNLTAFDYTVDLYAPADVDFRDYLTWTDLTTTLGATSVKLNNTTTVTTESGYTGNSTAVERLTLTVPVTTAGKSIAGLPYGTQYTVVEAYTYTQGDHNLYWEKSGGVDTRSSSYEINSASGSSVGITNNYTLVGSLTLNKDVVTSTGSTVSGVSESTDFVYEVTLQAADNSVDLSEYVTPSSVPGYVTSNGTTTEYWSGNNGPVKKYTFQVEVSEQTSRTINYIPVNTTYTVSEIYTNNTGLHHYKTGEVTTATAVAAGSNSATISNIYAQVGSLSLSKTVEATADSTVPTFDANKTFTFTVTLNALSGVDLKKYITYATLTDSNDFGATLTKVNGSASSADYTNNANAVTSIEFTVPVAASGTKSLSDLPYGTQYIVLETGETAPAGYKLVTTGQVEDAAQDEDDAKIGASNSASTVNTYTQLGKLKLVKALGSGIDCLAASEPHIVRDRFLITVRIFDCNSTFDAQYPHCSCVITSRKDDRQYGAYYHEPQNTEYHYL